MGLRFRLESEPETVQDLSLAAEERFADGLDCVTLGRHWSGVYLLGYSAEMFLKVACFKLDGAQPDQPVAPHFGPAKRWGRRFFPKVPYENFHNLWFWCLLLRCKRRYWGRSLLAPFDDNGLLRQTRLLHQTWWIAMRYRPAQIGPDETQAALDGASWIRNHSVELWR